MRAFWRIWFLVFLTVFGGASVFTGDQAVAQGKIERCKILPVQPGYGDRAHGQPGYGLPPGRPDCDISGKMAPLAPPPKGVLRPTATDLVNHGGPTVTSAAHYSLYLNCATTIASCFGNPSGFLTDLFENNSGTFFHNTDQYTGQTSNGRYTVSGSVANLTLSQPHVMMADTDVVQAVRAGVVALNPGGGGGGYNKIYNLFLPQGQDVCFDGASPQSCYCPDNNCNSGAFQVCSYHSVVDTTDANGAAIHVVYSVHPYQNVAGCSVTNGPNGALIDSTNNALSRQVFNLTTDPNLDAWWRSSDGQEISEICSLQPLINPITLNGHGYAIQQEYSNLSHACVSTFDIGPQPPANDNFANAITITPGQTTLSGTNVLATTETGEPTLTNSGGASVWWKCTATNASSSATVDTIGSSFDTMLGVFTGTAVNALTLVVQDDDGGGNLTSKVIFSSTVGTTYRIVVDGYHAATGTIALNLTNLSCASSGIAHDFNGDGKSDILWRDSGGNNAMWLMNSGAYTGAGLSSVPTIWSIVGQRDFDGNGKHDILWRDSSGNLAMWLMNGASVVTGAGLGNVPTTWTVVGTADFNADGKGDILWRDNTGNLAMWFMNGASYTGAGMGSISTVWSVAGVGDFNGDGKADIVWRNLSTGDVAIWLLNGASLVTGAGLGNVPTSWSIVATGDFNADGKADILWRDTSGNLAIWLMNGASYTGVGAGNVPTVWVVSETGDFNADGKADILWRNTGTGDVAIWFMNGAALTNGAGLGNVPTTWTIQSVNVD